MIYLIYDRAFIGPVVDMRAILKAWMESRIGPLEEWPGKPEDWLGPWPNFNNAQVQSYYFRRSQWHDKAKALIGDFHPGEGFTESEVEEI